MPMQFADDAALGPVALVIPLFRPVRGGRLPGVGLAGAVVDCCTCTGSAFGSTSVGRSMNFGVSTALGVSAAGAASEGCGASATAGVLATGFEVAVVAETSLESERLRESPAWAAADAKTIAVIKMSLRILCLPLAGASLSCAGGLLCEMDHKGRGLDEPVHGL